MTQAVHVLGLNFLYQHRHTLYVLGRSRYVFSSRSHHLPFQLFALVLLCLQFILKGFNPADQGIGSSLHNSRSITD